MTRQTKDYIAYVIFFLALIVGWILYAQMNGKAQVERPPLPRTWEAAYINDRSDRWTNEVSVDVVETSGACIYIVRTAPRDGDGGMRTHFLNKKDLAAGKGC